MRKAGLAAAGALLFGAVVCASAGAATLEPIGTATYTSPTYVTSDPRDPDRLFVTEQAGTIDVTTPSGTSLFLDLADRVLETGEGGLWSMAFAPDFAETGRFYVAYSADPSGAIVLDEYREQATPAATEATRREVLAITTSPAPVEHFGGQLQFGPDGYLFWSIGDAGNAGNAQDRSNLLGKILRIDPRGASPGAYSVPAENPFVGSAGADEIWAYGLRNPWRFTFDRTTGAMYIGDVGGSDHEELNLGVRGANYGWPNCEGVCAPPNPLFADPIYTYANDDPSCNAIIGGYVARDPDLGDLFGRYLFSDLCGADLRSLDPAAPPAPDTWRDEGLAIAGPASFGEDSCGRLYVVARNDPGQVFRLEGPSGGACPADTDPPETTLRLKRKSKRSERAKFLLGSDEPGSTFECKLDKGKWKPCGAKRKVKNLDQGKHKFRARATDAAGNTDKSPARKPFKVKPPR